MSSRERVRFAPQEILIQVDHLGQTAKVPARVSRGWAFHRDHYIAGRFPTYPYKREAAHAWKHGWTVTHVQCGKCLANGKTITEARTAARLLAAHLPNLAMITADDWNKKLNPAWRAWLIDLAHGKVAPAPLSNVLT